VAASIGQSDNLFTPIQLAVYAGALGMKGTRYEATFLNRVVSADYRTLVMENDSAVANILEISDDAYFAYNQGMQWVTSAGDGTASAYFTNYPIAVAGKTGTAQHGRSGSENGAFVCYAPAEKPEIAIAIYGEKAGHGNTLADIARSMLDVRFEIGEIGDVPTYENKLS
jgi:penicillin-binding protein 2